MSNFIRWYDDILGKIDSGEDVSGLDWIACGFIYCLEMIFTIILYILTIVTVPVWVIPYAIYKSIRYEK